MPGRRRYNTIRKAIFIALIAFSVFLSTTLFFYLYKPVAFRLAIFQPVCEFLFFQRELELTQNWKDIEKTRITPPERIEIPPNETSKLKIIADLRLPQERKLSSALLLLHGSSPWGRKNGLIALLSYRFQSAGWVTLLPDARGFCETEDPQDFINKNSWCAKYDVKRCLNFLSNHPITDSDRIYVLGHSMGASHALQGAFNDSRAKALILICPPGFPDGIKIGRWRRTRFSSDWRLNRLLPEDVVRLLTQKSDICNFVKAQLQNNSHLPILLIAGENEGDNKLKYFADATCNIRQPINFHIIKKAGHYLGVYNLFGSDIIFYQPDLFDPSVSLMLNFFNEIDSSR